MTGKYGSSVQNQQRVLGFPFRHLQRKNQLYPARYTCILLTKIIRNLKLKKGTDRSNCGQVENYVILSLLSLAHVNTFSVIQTAGK